MTYNVSMGTLNPTIPYHTNLIRGMGVIEKPSSFTEISCKVKIITHFSEIPDTDMATMKENNADNVSHCVLC